MTDILYNHLLHINDAQKMEMPKVPQIQEILVKYGFSKILGIARLHKHFNLETDEKVVWTFGERSYSQVLKGNFAPCIFQFTSKGIQPTEYYDGKDVWAEL